MQGTQETNTCKFYPRARIVRSRELYELQKEEAPHKNEKLIRTEKYFDTH